METETYKIEPSAYVRVVMGRWLARNVWAFVLPVILFFVLAAICSAAFIFVALMFIFLIFPFAVLMVYFLYAMKPRAIFMTRKNRLRFDGVEIRIENVESDDVPRYGDPMRFGMSDIMDVRVTKEHVCFISGRKIDDVIPIPRNAFSEDMFGAVISVIVARDR